MNWCLVLKCTTRDDKFFELLESYFHHRFISEGFLNTASAIHNREKHSKEINNDDPVGDLFYYSKNCKMFFLHTESVMICVLHKATLCFVALRETINFLFLTKSVNDT